MSDQIRVISEVSATKDIGILGETITIELEDSPTQIVHIQQDSPQTVVIEEIPQAVVEIAAEGLPGLPGQQGPQGPQGPAGPDLNTDLVDLTLLFENKLEYPGATTP